MQGKLKAGATLEMNRNVMAVLFYIQTGVYNGNLAVAKLATS
jgi:hypothetical protein